ncbi:MAG: toll/interleukin-1 receptor domain-containing protein [Lachnospiraceae bacterium]|nr:toll/interleukin-1 receptor domain-containing protein [Lachnospiraceae bacterium]
MRSLLANFPTEKLILHKPSGETYEVVSLVDSSNIMSEDTSIPIETNDYFERNLPNGLKEYYQVTDVDFEKGMDGFSDYYQTSVKKIYAPLVYEAKEELQKMIFISHSSKDKKYTKAFVDLLFGIGLNEDDIVCSSYPGLGVPLRESVYEWLVEKFQEYDLHILYFLSHNYYQSAASLNEMGAAWAMKQKWDGILLPGFSFSEIAGCIDPTQIGIKLDGDIDELKHRLGELKDDIIAEFGLRVISPTRWEKIRDSFISTIQGIRPTEEESKTDYYPAPVVSSDDSISVYACVMLMFAAEDNGQLFVAQTTSETSYQAGNKTMERSQNPRELALWDDAVAVLLKNGYIKRVGSKDPIYQVTATGYRIADGFKRDNGLDTSKSSAEILKAFDE